MSYFSVIGLQLARVFVCRVLLDQSPEDSRADGIRCNLSLTVRDANVAYCDFLGGLYCMVIRKYLRGVLDIIAILFDGAFWVCWNCGIIFANLI